MGTNQERKACKLLPKKLPRIMCLRSFFVVELVFISFDREDFKLGASKRIGRLCFGTADVR